MTNLKLVGPCKECGIQVDRNHDHKSWCSNGMLDVAIDMVMKGYGVQIGDPSDLSDRVVIRPTG